MILSAGILMMWCTASGQTPPEADNAVRSVKGLVRDAKTKEPLAAAQIVTLNQEAAATTDENGMFEIGVRTAGEVLLVRAIDYNPREIAVRGRERLEIDLYPISFTDLYPVIDGPSGSVRSTVSSAAMKGTSEMGYPTVVSVDEVIQSRLGGDVRAITKSGVPGIGSSLFIRGLNSVNLDAQPLFVVDGVIWNNFADVESLHNGFALNPLADIDLNDIANVTVIKDGTSLYGSKGGNGVILVNTTRGMDMATKIVVNATGGITEMPVSLPVMDGDQFRIYTTDLLGTLDIPSESFEEMGYLLDDPSRLDYKKYHNLTHWDDEVYRQGRYQNYNISVNGGDSKALYALSMGYTGVTGVVNTTDMQRLNTRFNADIFLANQVTLGMNIGFTNIDRTLLDDGVNFYTSPTYLAMIKASFLNPYTYTALGTLTTDVEDSDDFDVGNPTAIIQNALNTNKHYRLNLGLKPVYRITPSLTLSTLFNYSLDRMKETHYTPIIGAADRYIPGLGISENVFRHQQMRNTALFDDTQLTYKHLFGGVHRVSAIAGWRYISNYFELDYAEGHNSGSDQKRNLLTEEDFKNTYGENNRIHSVSNYANVDYSYDNRYFLTAAVSVDGSSRFGRETRGGFQMFNHSWGVFPSANAAWLVSSEKFMEGASFVDLLKIRAGFGLSGNDAIDPYARSAYFREVHYMDRAVGLVLANIANTEIQWETSAKLNLGVDANLLNDRIALSADVYSNRTSDLITLKSLPETTGTGYYWSNGGVLTNKGFEISATGKLLNLGILKWESGFSLGRYRNNIESLPDGDFITPVYGAEILTAAGNPAGVFFGYETDGIFNTEAEAEAAGLKMIDPDGTEYYFGAGDVHFIDHFEDGIIDEKDRQIIGNPNPDFYGSFNSKIRIWGITIGALFTFSYGNDIYNFLRSELESGSDFINQTTAMLNRWYYEGQETEQPKVSYGDPMGNARFSDRWIEEGSYLRLKSLSIHYPVPVSNNVIEGLTIWASVNNLWTWTNYLGRDPEVSAHSAVLLQGIDTGLIPSTRSYYVGIKLNL